jgi:hypothetical protein
MNRFRTAKVVRELIRIAKDGASGIISSERDIITASDNLGPAKLRQVFDFAYDRMIMDIYGGGDFVTDAVQGAREGPSRSQQLNVFTIANRIKVRSPQIVRRQARDRDDDELEGGSEPGSEPGSDVEL